MTGDDDDPKPSTYFAQTLLADPLPGGRYAGKRPRVTGTEPSVDALAVPDWARDPCGPEPPLGYSVEADAYVDSASTEAEGVAEDVSSLLPSDAMPDASLAAPDADLAEAVEPPVEPTYLGTLSSIGRRRDFHMVSGGKRSKSDV
jgi:hypothetical protein